MKNNSKKTVAVKVQRGIKVKSNVKAGGSTNHFCA